MWSDAVIRPTAT